MGMRTVVMLNNDMHHDWSKDPELGAKISLAASLYGREYSAFDRYGKVVEVTHADTQTLVQLDHYTGFTPIAYGMRHSGPSTEEDTVRLLKWAAEKVGYKLIKQSKKKA